MRLHLVLAGTLALGLGVLQSPTAHGAQPGDTFAAFHGTPAGAAPVTATDNAPLAVTGPRLRLQALEVGTGNLGFEPMVGVDRSGGVFDNARISEGCISNPVDGCAQINEQSIFRSTDAGATWSDISGGPSEHWTSMDPYLYVDGGTGRVFWLDMHDAGATLSISDDQGTTWTTNQIAALGENDRPTMVAGVPPAGAGLTPTDAAFPRIVYYCTNDIAHVSCARSLDGGRTFLPVSPPLLPMSEGGCSSQTGHMVTDAQGRVYVGGADCGVPYVAMSADGGQTWTNTIAMPQIDDTVTAIGSGNTEYNFNLAVDAAGTVYALKVSNRDNLPYLCVSHDHGATWSAPLMVAPPGAVEAVLPSITAGDAGRIALSFVATTAPSTDSTRPWSQYLVESTDGDAADPLFQSDDVVIPGTGTTIVGRGSSCCSGAHDFLNVTAAPLDQGRVWASLSDTCTGACLTDPTAKGDNNNIGRAYVVRQVGGPPLRGAASDIAAPPVDVPEAPWPAAAMLLAGLAWGVRRRVARLRPAR